MSHISALHEIMATRVWLATPSLVHATRDIFISNVNQRKPIEDIVASARELSVIPSLSCKSPITFHAAGSEKSNGSDEANEVEDAQGYHAIDTVITDPYTHEEIPTFIHVMEVRGGILRNSGACSDGSMDQRDELIRSTNDGALAHIIIVNSGGGQCDSLLDYEDGINYCRDHGQPVVAFVRGMACSCAYGLSAMTDWITASSRVDCVGCIGAMGAGFTIKDGDENAVSHETYRELYATKSVNKNIIHREISQGEYSKWQASLDEWEERFNAIVTKYRPSVQDDQKDGLDFDAGSVVGTLVDEVGDFQSAYEKAMQLAQDLQLSTRKNGTKAQ